MKEGTRLYINLTNKCNTACPFCCMYSDPSKNTFMTFDIFRNIIDNCKTDFELQLEGGEPLLHKDIFLFIEYAISTKRCKKVIILSNGILTDKYINRFLSVANWYDVLFEIKISINYHLINTQKDFLEKMNKIYFATKFTKNINVIFNVRKRKEDDNIEELLEKYNILEASNVYFLQSYGKLTGSDYDKPVIVQNINNWKIYSCDGTCFDQDLIARSEYEKGLL